MSTDNFRTESRGGCVIIHCEKAFTVESAAELKGLLLTQLTNGSNPAALILNIAVGAAINSHLFKAVAPVATQLRENNRKVYVVGAVGEAAGFLKMNGMDHLISIKKSIEEVVGASAPKLDVNFVNPFIDGAIQTLKVQCSYNARPGKSYLKGNGPVHEVEIAAVIGLTSRFFNGSVAICFPKKVFLVVMGNMIGEKYTEITSDLEDGASELLNIIFGYAKRVLNEKGYGFEKAIPTIVRGEHIRIRHLAPTPTIVLPFESDEGPFAIEIALDSPTPSAK